MLSTVIKVSSKRYVDNMSTQCTTHLVVDSHAEPLQSTFVDNCGERANFQIRMN